VTVCYPSAVTQADPLAQLLTSLGPFDPRSTAAIAGGLELMPENASRVIRLEALAHLAASLQEQDGKRTISVPKLRRLLNEGLIAISHYEDPCENNFTESFTFLNGSFVVLPGITESATFILKHLAKAIFLLATPFPDPEFVRAARCIMSAALQLSDQVCRRAGLSRGLIPNTSTGGEILVPGPHRLNALRGAVTFTTGEMADLLEAVATDETALRQLVTQFGAHAIGEYSVSDGPLFRHPILQHAAGGYVVAIPGVLLAAARHAVVDLAAKRGVVNELARRYTGAVWDSAKKYLEYLQHDSLPIAPPPLTMGNAQDGFFELDRDKLLYALLVTDPITDYKETEVFGWWGSETLVGTIEQRLREVEEYVFTWDPGPNNCLCLLLFEGIGRGAVFGFGKPCRYSQFLAMSASDLETVAHLEGLDQLALWKFASARSGIRDKSKVISTSLLDEFAVYRKHGYSYYFTDDPPPTLISISPGSAGDLQREVLHERDFHGAPAFNRGLVGEVASLHGTNRVPLYVPAPIRRDIAAVLVESLPVPLWVVGPNYEEQPAERDKHSCYLQFADAISFWLWQVTPGLGPHLETLAGSGNPVLIRLSLPGEAWDDLTKEIVGQGAPITVTSNADELELRIEIGPAIAPSLMRPDNEGERELLRHVLAGLRAIVSPPEGRLSDDEISAMIELHAPLGQKKKIMFLDLASNPRLDRRNIPRYRPLKNADDNQLLDEVGQHVSAIHPLGPIDDARRNEVLKDVVLFCVNRLEAEVSALQPQGLLEFVLAHHEAVIREYSFAQLTTPTQLACFHSEPEMIQQLQDQMPEMVRAALAGRILIECIAAKPPRGLRPVSLSVLDRIRTLAYNMANYGMMSDSIQYELADFSLSVLPSGRLGFSRGGYDRAAEQHMRLFAASRIPKAKAGFARHFRRPVAATTRPAIVEQLDAAFVAEAGYSVTDLVAVLDTVMAIGHEVDPGVTCLPEDDFAGRLIAKLEWHPDKVNKIVGDLVLAPREHYLEPPAPYMPADVYPWRYNRRLSYLRRPLVLRIAGERNEVLWGNRNVADARQQHTRLLLGGRFKAQSQELRTLLGSINHDETEAFNDTVADLFEKRPDIAVERRVKKVGKLRGPSGPPGDLDVLVAATKRRVVLVIECKDLSVARTPAELANEVANLVGNNPDDKSIVRKHQARIAWVERNLRAVLAFMGIESKQRWKVRGLIVTDEPLLAPHLRGSPVPILSFEELRKHVEAGKEISQLASRER